MGLLSVFYISTDADARRYDEDIESWPQAERAEYKRITPLELSTLWAIAQDREWDVASMDEFECLLIADEGERLIHRLPGPLVERLAGATDDDLERLAGRWVRTDELQLWRPEDAVEVLSDLRRLARSALVADRNLYLWNCV